MIYRFSCNQFNILNPILPEKDDIYGYNTDLDNADSPDVHDSRPWIPVVQEETGY